MQQGICHSDQFKNDAVARNPAHAVCRHDFLAASGIQEKKPAVASLGNDGTKLGHTPCVAFHGDLAPEGNRIADLYLAHIHRLEKSCSR